MNNGQLSTVTLVITGVFVVIGASLLVAGSRKSKRMLSIVGIAFVASAGISLFINSTELREILTAFAAVFAAIIAALSIYQTRLIRQDSVRRESRDRKERLLNEVTEWLRRLEDRIFTKPGPIKPRLRDDLQKDPEISQETWYQLEDLDVAIVEMNALLEGIKEAEYYQKLASKLDEELGRQVGVVVNNLKQRRELVYASAQSPRDYGELIRKIQQGVSGEDLVRSALWRELIEDSNRPLEGLNLSDRDTAIIRLGRSADATRKSILEALERVIDLKTDIISISQDDTAKMISL
jgi:hypothetical protein